ncbi:MAG TPA: peptide chain release factor N(5)-glutamine methyltransferase [Propionibacteriaceae bacterium]|nr:peptide chain release factor N(5)-glutamine methyltransferase [Propionibacteriaceae bacterium]
MTSPVRSLLSAATAQLSAAGIESAAQDARILLAFVSGVELVRLPLLDALENDHVRRFAELVDQRAQRVPLQHLTGRAHFRRVEVEVGPGVFVPRPETEAMTGWAIEALTEMTTLHHRPLVVELGTGSGAIAKAISTELTRTDIHAVEISPEAAAYARRNLADTLVELHVGDMATALPELNRTVDLVIANPPYIPLEAYESVPPEVRDHDPLLALFSGDDGLDAIRVVASTAARLLRPAGFVCVEHADVQGESAVEVFVRHGAFRGVRDHLDLNSRPRFVTAVRR